MSTWLSKRMPRYLIKYYFQLWLWGCFQKRLTFESVDWVKEIALTDVSEVSQSCLTLCDPMDCSLPDSSVHGIFQARILEWVAISSPRASSWPRDQTWIFKPGSPVLHADSLLSELPGKPCKRGKEGQKTTRLRKQLTMAIVSPAK